MIVKEFTGDRAKVKPLLLLADSREAIEQYERQGRIFVVMKAEEIVGVVLVLIDEESHAELKNVAVAEKIQGQGVGKLLVQKVLSYLLQEGLNKVTVCTANSSIGNLAFYQKLGFRITGVRVGFFESYDPPVIEHGILGRDLIVLSYDPPLKTD